MSKYVQTTQLSPDFAVSNTQFCRLYDPEGHLFAPFTPPYIGNTALWVLSDGPCVSRRQ